MSKPKRGYTTGVKQKPDELSYIRNNVAEAYRYARRDLSVLGAQTKGDQKSMGKQSFDKQKEAIELKKSWGVCRLSRYPKKAIVIPAGGRFYGFR